jgi:quercetin dioxygenase-like cupin family protein
VFAGLGAPDADRGGRIVDRKRLLIVAWAVVSLAGVTAAVATPQTGDVSRNELVVGKVLDDIELQLTEPSDVRIHQVTFNPGSSSGWHTHPGAEMAVVKAGALILQRAPGCDEITVAAGQGVFIPGGTPHLAHNDGKEPAEIYTTQIVPAGTTVLRADTDEQCVAQEAPDAPEESPEAPGEK